LAFFYSPWIFSLIFVWRNLRSAVRRRDLSASKPPHETIACVKTAARDNRLRQTRLDGKGFPKNRTVRLKLLKHSLTYHNETACKHYELNNFANEKAAIYLSDSFRLKSIGMNNRTPDLIRVLLVENQTLVVVGIRTILSGQNDIEIVGEAATGAEGFKLFRTLKPDVTIMSLRLPDSCAIDVLGDYFNADKRAVILILAEYAGDSEISRSLKKGVAGYICKDVSEVELIKAIRVINAGKKYIPADIAEILNENFNREELTPRERKILQMLVGGNSNKEIAFDLNVSENTVKTHVKNIFEKLGVSDRTSAVTLAIRRGLVRIDV